MPNIVVPFGLKPVRNASGAPFNGSLEMMLIPSTLATAVFVGDPIVKDGGADAAGVASAVLTAANGSISGVIQGFVPNGVVDLTGYRAASTAAYALVCTDPDALFAIMDDGVGGGTVAADIGLNASIVVAAGNTFTRSSGVKLGGASKATTATLELKIMGLLQTPQNAVGANAVVLVKINKHTDAVGVVGV